MRLSAMNQIVGLPLAYPEYRFPAPHDVVPSAVKMRPRPRHLLVGGKGMHVWDQHGVQLLDGMAGNWDALAGHAHGEIAQAAARSIRNFGQCATKSAAAATAEELADRLVDLLPFPAGRMFHTRGAAEASAMAQQLAQHFWKMAGKPHKRSIITRRHADRDKWRQPAMATQSRQDWEGCFNIAAPAWFGYQGLLSEYEFGQAAAHELEKRVLELGADSVAAFIAEPFQTLDGAIYPPYSYWPEIQRICQRYEILLCLDESKSGLGRAGQWLGCVHVGVEPDAVVLGDALTSGYVPMGALLLSQRMADALERDAEPAGHAWESQGMALAGAVALANLNLLDDGQLVAHAANDVGLYLQFCLRERFDGHPLVGEIQGSGMAGALQLSPSPHVKMRFDDPGAVGLLCRDLAWERQLVVQAVEDRIVLAPALIARHDDIDEIIDKLGAALDAAVIALRRP